jgi:hypothetical protein
MNPTTIQLPTLSGALCRWIWPSAKAGDARAGHVLRRLASVLRNRALGLRLPMTLQTPSRLVGHAEMSANVRAAKVMCYVHAGDLARARGLLEAYRRDGLHSRG